MAGTLSANSALSSAGSSRRCPARPCLPSPGLPVGWAAQEPGLRLHRVREQGQPGRDSFLHVTGGNRPGEAQ